MKAQYIFKGIERAGSRKATEDKQTGERQLQYNSSSIIVYSTIDTTVLLILLLSLQKSAVSRKNADKIKQEKSIQGKQGMVLSPPFFLGATPALTGSYNETASGAVGQWGKEMTKK